MAVPSKENQRPTQFEEWQSEKRILKNKIITLRSIIKKQRIESKKARRGK